MKSILAILVLYRMSLAGSPTYRSLDKAMNEYPDVRGAIDLQVADNSAEAHEVPADFAGRYIHDGGNPGLARRYNQALAAATAGNTEWLLLLDQDTTLTPEYMQELLALSEELVDRPEVVIILPKLIVGERIYSPHPPRYLRARYKVERSSSGVLGSLLMGFNSAALVRVSALNAIGGFPEAYWLDFLDHATFTRLQRAGGRAYLMRASLMHDLSETNPKTADTAATYARTENRLLAEERFYAEFGSLQERFLHRVDLLRQFIGLGRRGKFLAAKLRLKFLLRTTVVPRTA